MPKKVFEGWKWDIVKAEVQSNMNDKITIFFYWNIPSKKNSKRFYRGIALPSANYLEWHKRVEKCLKDIKWNYDIYPCKIDIKTIAWEKRRKDIDNVSTSILDLLVDMWIIPDDSNDIVHQLDILNVWYIKNCPMTRVDITPYLYNRYDIADDHKDMELSNYKRYLDWYILRDEKMN